MQKEASLINLSRRQFMLTATYSAAGVLLPGPVRAAVLGAASWEAETIANARRLDSGWQFRQGAIGSIAEVWRSEDKGLWQEADLPHCYNGLDSCDPDHSYYRGQGWYRTHLPLHNPFPDGRTILHFQGAGQTTSLWVGSTLIGTHKGGYDEFSFDITDAVQRLTLAGSN